MKKTKLYKLFSTLSARELNNWEAFLNSPFMNRRKDVITLLNFMINERKKKNPNYDNETVFALLYPNEQYDSRKIDMTISRLYRLGEKYLAYKQIEKNEYLLKMNTAKAYKELKMKTEYQKMINDAQKALENTPCRNADYLHKEYSISYDQISFLKVKEIYDKVNVQEMVNKFDAYYFANKLKLACHILSHKAIMYSQIDKGLLSELIVFLEKDEKYLREQAVAIYYNLYKIYYYMHECGGDLAIMLALAEENYLNLKELYPYAQENFYPYEKKGVFTSMLNFCIKKSNNDQTKSGKYQRELFDWYRLGLDEGHVLEDGFIRFSTFGNIVSLSLKLNELNWAEYFVNEYKSRIEYNEDSNYLINYSYARIFYHEKKYKEVLSKLDPQPRKNFNLNTRMRILILQAEYELKDECDIRNTKNYINTHRKAFIKKARKAFIEENREVYMEKYVEDYEEKLEEDFTKKHGEVKPPKYVFFDNFLDVFKDLDDSRYDKSKRLALLVKVQNTKDIFDKEWLIDKLS